MSHAEEVLEICLLKKLVSFIYYLLEIYTEYIFPSA